MEFLPMEDFMKLGLAVLVGGLIGAEREFRDKAAGFRTIIFITVGATLFTLFSIQIGAGSNPTRIAANIVTGIGFLGAGAIMRSGSKIAGLTTAATIWLAAALGMGIGGGQYQLVIAATGVILIVLWIFPPIEHVIDNIYHVRIYHITTNINSDYLQTLPELFREHSLRASSFSQTKSDDRITASWRVHGRPHNHARLIAILVQDPEILEFKH